MATEYDDIITEQKELGVIEPADEQAKGVEFYIPHKSVVRETAKTTKTRIAYNASSRAAPDALSLNGRASAFTLDLPFRINSGTSLCVNVHIQKLLTRDMKKAFLQIRIRKAERDALRFRWRRNELAELETLRFTRALFGLISSTFLFGGVLEHHLTTLGRENAEHCCRITT